jgi:Phytanoyl-CoA dioxygenase (PhyH)
LFFDYININRHKRRAARSSLFGGSCASRRLTDGKMEPVNGELAERGYAVLRQAVPVDACRAALRLLTLAIRRHGLSAEEIAHCQSATFFPQLRWEPEVWAVLPSMAAEVLGWAEGDDWAEPQLLLRFPDEDQPWPLEPHVDSAPPWAEHRRYKGIVGVALTPAGPLDGTPHVWPGSHRGAGDTHPVPVPLNPGDAIVMHPALQHCGSLNLGASIRAAIYFRLLTPIS